VSLGGVTVSAIGTVPSSESVHRKRLSPLEVSGAHTRPAAHSRVCRQLSLRCRDPSIEHALVAPSASATIATAHRFAALRTTLSLTTHLRAQRAG
jgi:hypothetical protein